MKRTSSLKGRTYEQIYGKNAALERQKRADGNKGKSHSTKGKTYGQIYKSDAERQKYIRTFGRYRTSRLRFMIIELKKLFRRIIR